MLLHVLVGPQCLYNYKYPKIKHTFFVEIIYFRPIFHFTYPYKVRHNFTY